MKYQPSVCSNNSNNSEVRTVVLTRDPLLAPFQFLAELINSCRFSFSDVPLINTGELWEVGTVVLTCDLPPGTVPSVQLLYKIIIVDNNKWY